MASLDFGQPFDKSRSNVTRPSIDEEAPTSQEDPSQDELAIHPAREFIGGALHPVGLLAYPERFDELCLLAVWEIATCDC